MSVERAKAVCRDAILLLTGVATGVALTTLPAVSGAVRAAEGARYKVEQLGTRVRQPEAFQALLEERADEGWLLQALDHETLVFRRAAARRAAPTPSPEP